MEQELLAQALSLPTVAQLLYPQSCLIPMFPSLGLCWEEQAEFLSFFPCQDSVGEPLYMLFRGIKHQVDKGPVDWVTGKAKYTLNDNRLLREDLEYRTLVSAKPSVLPATAGLNVSAPITKAQVQHPAAVGWESADTSA